MSEKINHNISLTFFSKQPLPFLYFLLLPFFSAAQKSLSGRVMIVNTKQPVASASVYLANTSVGTATNEKGVFQITHFPDGRYDLVVSCIGYETYHVTVQSGQPENDLEIFLQPKTQELKEVIVESFDKEGWNKWGQIFTDIFIGTSAFAADCRLENKEAVKLKLLTKTNVIRATADEPLIIKNNALGYTLKYNLTLFEFNLDTKQFFFEGFPFFEEMKTTRKGLERSWAQNREEAYYGSLTHFMRSLYQDKIKESNFEIHEVVNVSPAERRRIKEMYRYQLKKTLAKQENISAAGGYNFLINEKDTAKYIHPDSLAYYKSVIQHTETDFIALTPALTSKELVYKITDSVQVGLTHKNRLLVSYLPKKNPAGYQRFVTRSEMYNPVRSELIRAGKEEVFILPEGIFYEGANLVVEGFWSWWEKMCNKLPYNYIPGKDPQ